MITLLITLAQAQALDARSSVDIPITLAAGSVWLSLYTQPERQSLLPGSTAEPTGIDALAPTELNEEIASISDLALYAGLGGGALLAGAQKNRGDTLLLYAEALAINGALTELTKHAVRRPRPYTLGGEAVDADDQKSFFSGHTSFVATSAFFAARSVDLQYDLDPLRAGAVYGSAALLTAGMGGMRVAAGKHFPSDVLTGALVGGAVGWLVPELHQEETMQLALTTRSVQVSGRW